MKKISQILLIGISLITTIEMTSCAYTANTQQKEIKKLIREFDRKPGFEANNISSFAVSLIKAAAKSSEDDDVVVAIRAMDKVHGVSIVDMEDCSLATQIEFQNRLFSIIGEDSMLMSVKEDGDDVRFYGKISADGLNIEDIIIYSVEDSVMICIWGRISTEGLAELAKSQEE